MGASALALAAATVGMTWQSTEAQGLVVVTGVAINHSSVKVYYNPVAGAKDYRVYDVANPNSFKYAGLVRLAPSSECPGSSCFHHFAVQSDGSPAFPYQIVAGATGGPQVLDVPATTIEWNDIGNNNVHTLVVEAVDTLGPVPPGSLYTGLMTTPFLSVPPAGAMLGGDKGATTDGKTSTNGQGPYTNSPQVIARSAPFVVKADTNAKAIPSKATATQTFFDTFENAEGSTIQLVSRDDATTDAFGSLGSKRYVMNSGTPKAWQIEFRRTDNINSMPFVAGDHFMDMVFDGATPGGSAPTHTIYGSMSMTPVQTADMSGGKILHLTMEVDGHQSLRRWVNFALSPASAPLQNWDPNGYPISNTNQGIFLEFRDGGCTLDIFTGPSPSAGQAPTGTAGEPGHGARLWGAPGSSGGAPIFCIGEQMYNPKNFSKNSRGLDDRSRYDFFISQTHAAVFQDGRLIVQSDIPAGTFPWGNGLVKAYYSHYLYHSEEEQLNEIPHFNLNGQTMCYPLNSYWFNDPVAGTAASKTVCNIAYPPGYGFPNSDERHWDNMGFEVLPGAEAPAGDYAVLSSLIQLPSVVPPQFGSGGTPPAAPTNLRIVQQLLDWFVAEPKPAFADERNRANWLRPSSIKPASSPGVVVDDPICAPITTKFTQLVPATMDRAPSRM